jgi:hypothetical protein
MDELGGNLADETTEMMSEPVVHPTEELRKRRSTRIVQAVPLVVTGVDALGRPFTERTSTLIVNCHGCRYQSKHYVLKNMWVTLEIPHPESGQPPRSVRGRVAWIQRPRTVRQLFQVALELELPGNIWGIAFPPEDWFAFCDAGTAQPALHDAAPLPELAAAAEIHLPLGEPELPAAAIGSDNLRVFPSPASATDASLQLARHVTRLLAEAKQQIQAATREAAAHAVSAERHLAKEEWEQKFASAREELAREVSQAVERIQQESEARSRAAYNVAAETWQSELPGRLAPLLEQLMRELTQEISNHSAAQRGEHAQQLADTAESLRAVCQQAEEAAARLRAQAEQSEALIAARAEAATRAVEETARQREETAGAQRESLNAAANETQQQVVAALAAAHASWQSQLSGEIEAAQDRWRATIESVLVEARDRGAGGLNEHVRTLQAQLQEEAARQGATLQESAAGTSLETGERLARHRESLREQAERVEAALGRSGESIQRLEHFSARIETSQQQALAGFQSQLDDVLSLHRNELHRRSDSLFEEINARIRGTFEDSSRSAAANFEQQIANLVRPHVSDAQEAIHRLAGGRSLLDAAMTLQQERIRSLADEAFAEALGRFRENLGGAEQLLRETSQAITGGSLADLEGRAGELRRSILEDLLKSAEWYEKKAQTQIQNHAEKTLELTDVHLREKAGEISGMFASELDHSSRNFLGHAQTQMEEVVRDSFERARALFSEAAETTAAAFTDEIQRTARQELDGFGEELQRSAMETRAQLDTARAEHAQRVTTEQEDFLRRFQAGVSGAVDAGVADAYQKVQGGIAPLLDSWKSMTEAHQAELQSVYAQIGDQSAERHKTRLENVSTQWMLATVAALDHQSRDVVNSIAATAAEKLREACVQVFADMGDTLRERLKEIAANFTPSPEPPERARSANTGN